MADGRPVTLYCLAHAGAGCDTFHRWNVSAGADVRVVALPLPGRKGRRDERRVTGRDGLLAELLDGLDQRPFALYGHSLGGLVAYTLARALADKGLPQPAFVALGATPPPDEPPALLHAGDATVDELLAHLGDLGALPGAELTAPGGIWRRKVLPVLRDDLRLAAALREAALDPSTGGPLDVPLLVLGGADDPVARADVLDGWRRWTSGPFVRRTVAGDHFFVRGRRAPQLVGRACRVARRLASPTPPAVRTTVRNSR